jgi:hypothetical protein
MARKAVPVINQSEFDQRLSAIRSDLQTWYDDETTPVTAPPPTTPATAPVWQGMPEIDSKAVVKASPVIRRHLGIDLDPSLIRKGGYASFDDMTNDLLPKLRNICPPAQPVITSPTTTTP